MSTPEQDVGWANEDGQISRLRGRAFEAVCLSAVSFALVSVLVLLLYVAADALRPFSAEVGWYVVYGLTVVLPVGVMVVYFYRRDRAAGEVAYVTTGLPIVGVLLAMGFLITLIELVTVFELFATIAATGVAVVAILAHTRYRPRAAFERLVVLIGAPMAAVYGIPPAEFLTVFNWAAGALGLDIGLNSRVMSLRELVLLSPIRPTVSMMLLSAVTLPVAAGFGAYVARRRDSRREGLAFAGLGFGGAAVAGLIGPVIALDAIAWILLFTWIVVPLAFYVEGVHRRGDGELGVVFPVVLLAGIGLGAVLTSQFGLAGPDSWLDWGFLTSPHSRTPADAGFYPPIVGSVMMLIVIALSAFPIGVGAAIYLEEYAPETGLAGRIVSAVEVNIGNLAGVPSVVYGLLGLALFIRYINMPTGAVLAGGLAVGLLILPIVIIAAQEAVRAVPDSHREASLGMGATRWQTTRKVVLPQAFPGILTGTILAVGRAIGETAPLLMIGAASSVRLAPNGFYDQLPAMPRQIFAWSRNLEPEIRHGVLAAGVVTLLVVLLILNATAIVLRNKYQRAS